MNAVKTSGGLRERLFNAAYNAKKQAILNGNLFINQHVLCFFGSTRLLSFLYSFKCYSFAIKILFAVSLTLSKFTCKTLEGKVLSILMHFFIGRNE